MKNLCNVLEMFHSMEVLNLAIIMAFANAEIVFVKQVGMDWIADATLLLALISVQETENVNVVNVIVLKGGMAIHVHAEPEFCVLPKENG